MNHAFGDDTLNSEYLGDALDHWKGSLISILVSKQLLRSIVVEPMITDPQPWQPEDIQTYRRLLGLEEIFHAESTFPGGRRKDYFNEVPKDDDIFLDPDTGIAMDRAIKKHIAVPELIKLLGESDSDRVFMVYQHSGQRESKQEGQTNSKFKRWLLAMKDKLTDKDKLPANVDVHCTVYECKQVAMFFISRNRNRIDEIKDVLQECLKGKAQRRVW
ncbi:MAG: hypothetical protein ACHQ2F_13455 [Desulfobaccales bacterium]